MAESSPPSRPCDDSGPEIPESIKKSVRAVLLSKVGGVPLQRFLTDYKKLDGNALDFKGLGFKTLHLFLEGMPDVVRMKYSEQADLVMLYGIADTKSYMSSAAKKAQFSRPNDGVKEKKKMSKGKKKQGGKDQPGMQDKGPNATTKHGKNEKGDAPPTQTSTGAGKKGNAAKTRSSPNEKGHAPARVPPIDSHRGSPRGPGFPDGKAQEGGEIHVARSQRGLYTVCVRCNMSFDPSDKAAIMEEIRELFAEQGDVVEENSVRRLMFFRFHHEHEAVDVIKKYDGRRLRNNCKICVTPGNEKMPAKQPVEGAIPVHDNWHATNERREPERGKAVRPIPIPVPCVENENLDSEDNLVNICVFNLPKSSTVDDLMHHFIMFQPVKGKVYTKDKSGPRFTKKMHHGLLSFSSIMAAYSAKEALHGSMMNGNEIRVELAMTKSRAAQAGEEMMGATDDTVMHNNNHMSLNGHKETSRSSSRSGDESSDSISQEVPPHRDLQSPPLISSKVPGAVDDFPYAVRSHQSQLDEQNSDEKSPAKPEGLPLGRGRGAWRGHVSPSFGRGFPLSAPMVQPAPAPASAAKKKLRPSLADLIDKLDEL